MLCIIAARRAGAANIVATDLADNALAIASLCGADRVVNVVKETDALTEYKNNKGHFDVMYECSGNVHALSAGIETLRPGSILMQLGLGGDMTLPMMQLTAKEIDLRGSFRFHSEFSLAVDLMRSGLVDVKPLISHTVELHNAVSAFEIANDRSKAMKSQIAFAV